MPLISIGFHVYEFAVIASGYCQLSSRFVQKLSLTGIWEILQRTLWFYLPDSETDQRGSGSPCNLHRVAHTVYGVAGYGKDLIRSSVWRLDECPSLLAARKKDESEDIPNS
jgi:hypothetical protein